MKKIDLTKLVPVIGDVAKELENAIEPTLKGVCLAYPKTSGIILHFAILKMVTEEFINCTPDEMSVEESLEKTKEFIIEYFTKLSIKNLEEQCQN